MKAASKAMTKQWRQRRGEGRNSIEASEYSQRQKTQLNERATKPEEMTRKAA